MQNIKIEEGNIILSLNPKLYSLDIIYSASYIFLDRAYIILDGDPDQEIQVIIRPKQDEDPEKLGLDFYEELINYASYKKLADSNSEIRTSILQRSLLTNNPDIIKDMDNNEQDDVIQDPKNISEIWEEKGTKKDESD